MNNNSFVEKNMSVGKLILSLLMLLIVVVGGTFAWLTYSSKESALVLTIGDINDTQIKLSPYQVTGSITPGTSHTSGVYSEVEVTKGNNNSTSFSLFYKINDLDVKLINKGLSYTIVNTKGTESTGDDVTVKTGKFSDLIDTSKPLPKEVIILDTNTDSSLSANTSTYYRVYLWVDSNVGNQSDIQNSNLNVELNGSIGSVKITGYSVYGHTLTVNVNDTVIDNSTSYSYQWYSSSTSTTKNGTAISGATSSSYTVGSGLVGKYIYVVVTTSKGKTLSDVTDSGNNYDISQECDNFNDGRVEKATPVLTLSATSGAVEAGSDNQFTTSVNKSPSYVGANYTGKQTAVSEDTNNVTVTAGNEVGMTIGVSSAGSSTIKYHGMETKEAKSNITVTFTPNDTANICPVSASYEVDKTDNTVPTTPGLTLIDCDTFTYSSTDIVGVTGYYISTSSTKPSATADGWVSATTTTKNITIGTSAQTYYVWAKDAKGNISSSTNTSLIKITRTEGTGTILTTKYNGSNGTTYDTSIYVLKNCPVYSSAVLNTGYNSLLLKYNNSSVTTTGASATVTADFSVESTSVANTYVIGYSLNGGTKGTNAPISGRFDEILTIDNPTKTFVVNVTNSAGGTLSATSVNKTQTFAGWTFNGTTNTALYGTSSSNVTSSWNSTSTKVTAKYFKNLTSTNDATVTMTANWTAVNLTLPTITKQGYTCGFTATNGGTDIDYSSGASYTPSTTTSSVTLYTICVQNNYSISYSLNGGAEGTNAPTSGTFDEILTIDNPTKSGYTFTGWTFNGNTATAKYGTSSSNVTTAWSDGNTKVKAKYFKNLNPTKGSTVTLTAHWEKTVTGTFYYWDGNAIASKQSSCTMYDASTTCTITLPSEVSSSVGQYGNEYIGISKSTSSMSVGASLSIANNTTYYAVYRSKVTIYRPTSETAAGSIDVYRNSFFTSTSALVNRLATSTTGTSTMTSVSGMLGTLKGFSTTVNSSTVVYDSIDKLLTSTTTTAYAISTSSIQATFYYNSNKTAGSLTVSTATASGARTNYCSSTTATATIAGAITVPTAVSGSVGKYNSTYKGVSTGTASLTTTSPTTAITTYYAFYSGQVTIYRPTSVSACSAVSTATETYYRNEWFTSTSAMSASISTSQTSMSNITSVSGIFGTFGGLNNTVNNSTVSTVASMATNSSTTLYALSTSSISATFYYNSNTTAGSLTVSTTTASGTRTNYCSSTSVATTSAGSITVPTAVSGSVGKYNMPYKGVSTSLNSMTTTNPTTATTTYYAVYQNDTSSNAYKIYYPTSTSAVSSLTVYRNEFFGTTSAMNTIISTSSTGLSDVSSISEILGTYLGVNSSVDDGSSYNSISKYATSTALSRTEPVNLYALSKSTVEATFYYNSNTTAGSLTVSTATASGTRINYCKSTSAAATREGTITVPTAVSDSVGQYNGDYRGITTNTDSLTYVQPTTATTTYFAFYSGIVLIYRPTSTTACSEIEYVRNEWFTNSSAMNVAIASRRDSKDNITTVDGILDKFSGLATSVNSTSAITVEDAAFNSTYIFYGISKTSVEATFYYNSNTTAGSLTVSTATASGNRINYCSSTSAATTREGTITVPSAVSGSVGKYNMPYKGVSTSLSSMTTRNPFTVTTTYYAVYQNDTSSNAYNIYYPISTTAISNVSVYRNEFFTSTSAMSAVISTSSTGTSNLTTISKILGTYLGVDLIADSTKANAISTYATSTSLSTTAAVDLYAISSSTVDVAFYYNSNTTVGQFTSATEIVTETIIYTVDLVDNDGIEPIVINVPDVVRNSVGQYNMPFEGVASDPNSMAVVKADTADTTYYAVYQNNTSTNAYKIYYPTTDACGSRTAYRNEFFTSTSEMSTVISTSSGGTSNLTTISGILGTYAGVNSSVNNSTANAISTYATSTSLSRTEAVNLYAVSTSSVEATFYYNRSNDLGIFTLAFVSASGDRFNYCKTTSVAATSEGIIPVPPEVQDSKGVYGGNFEGVSLSPENLVLTTPTTANGEVNYYAVYYRPISLYKPTSASVCSSSSAYLAEVFTTDLSTTYGVFLLENGDLDDSLYYSAYPNDPSAEFGNTFYTSGVETIKLPISDNYYTIDWFNTKVTYNVNGGTGSVANTTGTFKRYCTSNTEATESGETPISSTEPTRTDYNFMGWATSSTATSATYFKGKNYSIMTKHGTLSGNILTLNLYAVWQKPCKITYYNGTTSLGTTEFKCDMPTTLKKFGSGGFGASPSYSSYGWSFDGWSTDSTSVTKSVDDGASVSFDEDTSLYAIYDRTVYFYSGIDGDGTIDDDSDGFPDELYLDGTVIQTYSSYSKTASSMTAPKIGGSINGWTIAGYRNDDLAGSYEYRSSSSSTARTITPAYGGSNILYAVYIRSFIVNYIANDSLFKTQSLNHSYLNSANKAGNSLPIVDFTVITDVPTKTGYPFLGWHPDSNFVGTYGTSVTDETIYESGKRFTSNNTSDSYPSDPWSSLPYDAYPYSGNFVAVFGNPSTCTISYNYNGGTKGTYAPTSITYDTAIQISKPTKSGYTFAGWTFNGNTSTALYGSSSSSVTSSWSSTDMKVVGPYFKNLCTTDGSSISMTANWASNSYIISYNLNGATAGTSSPTSATYDTSVHISNAIPAPGYTFEGWTFNGNTSTAKYGSSSSSVTSSWSSTSTKVKSQYFKNLISVGSTVTMTANLNPISYNIAYQLNGGTSGGFAPTTAKYDVAVQISTPVRSGYKFGGWTFNGNTSTALYGSSSSSVTSSWNSTDMLVVDATYFKNLTLTSGSTVTLTANWITQDTTPPNISFTTNGSSSYTTTKGTVVTVTDPSGVKTLKYKWSTSASDTASSGTTFTSGNSITNSTNTGKYYLIVYACDNFDNCTTTASNVFYLDNAEPSVDIDTYIGNIVSTSAATTYNGSWTKNVVLAHVRYRDAQSGINTNAVSYKVAGQSSYTAVPNPGSDRTNFRFGQAATTSIPNAVKVETASTGYSYFKVCDKAGNCAEEPFTLRQDFTAPIASCSPNGYVGSSSEASKIVTFAVTDSLSGVNFSGASWYKVMDTQASPQSGTTIVRQATSITIPLKTTKQYINYRVCDMVGNCEAYGCERPFYKSS